MEEKKIKSIECRFAVLCKSNDYTSDLHMVKELITYEDGSTAPNIRLINNYKRKFWITKNGMRNHKQKKESEKIENLIEYETTSTNMIRDISKAIGEPWFTGGLRKLCRNPYIYGADIMSTAVIKKSYQQKYPEANSYYSMATFDIETDVNNGTDEILMATLSFKNRVVTVIKDTFLDGYSDVNNRLQNLLIKYLGPYVNKRKIEWEVLIVDSESKIVTECFKRAHEWKPDFIAIWNINFDLPKVVAALERAELDPKDVFSDPSIPKQYRHFSYVQGPSQKVTASGKITPIKPSGQWHTAYCPSSWYFIDAMCAYRQIRTGSAEEPSYSLDAILQKHLGIRKLNFVEAEKYRGIEWHQYMQSAHPLEYVIYNVFDCISMEELDEKILDLCLTLPQYSGCSDFSKFNSQPRRLVDNLHYFFLEKGLVIGTTSDEMRDELDSLTVGLDDWIITLPAHLVADNGLKIIEEMPLLRSNVRGHVAD